MNVVDPREEYDDIIVTHDEEVLEPEQFRTDENSEAAEVGWVVIGLVFDDENRVLLIDQSWADGWMAPGGTLKPGESLDEAVVREVREETGIKTTPKRPHALINVTVVHERTEETFLLRIVLFEVTAQTTEIGNDLGIEYEEINDARWFESLPEDMFNREMTERVYQRCVRRRNTG